ncbi:polymeric immunoglobulin receptor-like isoform X2 [Poecilia latipinna]|uniref:polymeric immunoglobulin receptor-like isoform X2 n=1 Tax=Poecilia latipinna TaxID=48699 RepID=UPI00072E95B7|nr:PREDICTED: polymeric immunoglobulin receptor-like isoform X2 [Poecilia latipinna]
MIVHHTLFCLFFLSLQDRISSSANALINTYGAAGEEVRVQCAVSFSGAWKIFCRETCEGGNILIKTNQPTDQRGRYRTECVKEATSAFSLYVSISDLTRSDEGRYRCGLGDSSSSGSLQDFRLVVVDALLDGSKVPHLHKDAGSSLTVACSFKSSGRKRQFCRGGCGKDEVLLQTDGVTADKSRYYMKYEDQKSRAVLLVTIKQLVQSDSGRYRCKLDGTGSSSSYRDFQVTVRTASTPSTGTSSSSSSGSFTASLPSETSGLNQENSTSKGSPTHSE